MEALSSFSARRLAAGALPAFSLPPPNSDVPRTTDGLSPSLSSVNTTSSQASHSHSNMYTYGGAVNQGWNGANTSPYQTQGQQAMPQSPYGNRHLYGYANQRNPQSPATGAESLPAPPFDQVQHPGFHHHDSHGTMTSAPPSHGGILASTQAPTASSATAHVDAYSHSRPPSNASYYTTSAPQQQPFSSYPPQQSPTLPSPPSSASRGLTSQSMHGQHPQPGLNSYRSYPYQPVANMGGPVMSNMHQPGGQMAIIPGMGVPPGYGAHAMMYNHNQPQPQSERPFKCDQCIQSFSRNHDLKRHKRIHLAVKPFPCSFCSKSFSRKDALKRHRLVKGCENKINENASTDTQDRSSNGDNGSSTRRDM